MTSSNPIDRLFGAVVPRAVDAVDIDSVIGQVDIDKLISEVDMDKVLERVDVEKLIERIDLNLLLERVDLTVLLQRLDLDALIGRLDINAVVGQVDIDGLVKKVDINGIVQQVDVDGIIKKVDINGIIQQVDVDGIIQQVDVDGIIGKVDMPALMKRAQIDVIVSNASRGVFTRVLDALRRQLAGVDTVLIGLVNRLFRRPRELETITGGTVTGRIAGGVSRLVAWMADAFTIAFSYGLVVALGLFMVGLFTGDEITVNNSANNSALWYVLGYATFGFLYYWIGLTLTGRSIGKGLVGLRVVGRDGRPITPGRAAVRTLVYPISFILWIGLVPIVTGKRRRALHDWAAGCTVVYDWGDRPSELPAPVTDWLQRHDVDARPDTVPAVSSIAVVSTNGTADTSTNGTAPSSTSTAPAEVPTAEN